jgi:Domain of unknown function (DUF4129)
VSLRRGAREAVLVAALLVLLGAVAITAGMAHRSDQAALPPPPLSPQALLGWAIVAAVVGGIGYAVLGRLWTGPEKLVGLAVIAVLVLGLLLLAQRNAVTTTTPPPSQPITTAAPHTPPAQATPVPGSTPPPPTPPTATQPRQNQILPAWMVALLGALAAAGAATLLAVSGRARSTAGPAAPPLPLLSSDVDASLSAAEAEPDPRRAVVAAWMGMSDALARRGLRRRPHEAPLEYMRRALTGVRASSDSVCRLTALFESARFSDHPVGSAQREEALAALRDVRDELRSAEHQPPQ